jgi:glyoxylase-like metal-dependent hydrolase (beta-lactamase superfamily II)
MIERIVAPNPGPMTLGGTNTYVLSDGTGNVAVVDPGPADAPAHVDAVLQAAAGRGQIVAVIATHRHLDHLPAARQVCERTGAPLVGHPELPGVQRAVGDRAQVFDGFVALHTPGHTRDSVCLWSAAERSLLTGDLVLGSGTAVLDESPTALSEYMASLERLLALRPAIIYPGHGPLVADAQARLNEYLEHRRERVSQVIAALRAVGAATAEDLATAIYTDTPANLLPMAARNVRANLHLLVAQGQARQLSSGQWTLTAS